MLRVLSPEEVIESREKLLDDLEEALLGDPTKWHGKFPGNFTLYDALFRVFKLWEEGEKTYAKHEALIEKSCGCL